MRQLKEMGITDIMQLTLTGCAVNHPTKNKQAYALQYSGYGKLKMPQSYDPFMVLVKAAAREGLNVTVKMQVHNGPKRPAVEARDSKGKAYSNGLPPDYLSPELRKFIREMLDEYTTKYNIYGNIKGFYIDMPYYNMDDCFGDDFDVFEEFCLKEFGEAPPEEILEKMEQGNKWIDPKDKWWRRFFLFKQWVAEDFLKDVFDYCHQKGLEFGLQVNPTVGYGTGWSWGHNTYSLSKLADWLFTYPGSEHMEPCHLLDNSTPGIFVGESFGSYNTYSFRGQDMGLHYLFNSLWDPVFPSGLSFGGYTSEVTMQYQKHIISQREWARAKSLTRAAILNNQNYLHMGAGIGQLKENKKEIETAKMLSCHLDIDRLFVEATDKYTNYRVLITPKYGVGGLSAEIFNELKQFVEQGGTIINLNARWFVSRADLTNEKDVTAEMTGSGYSTEKGKRPDVTEKSIGKGKVISIYADIEGEKGKELLCSLVKEYSRPEISIKSDSAIRFRAITTLKKNNWVAVSLYSDDKTPAKGTVSIDIEKLGVKKDGYRILLLGRGMELLKSKEHWESPPVHVSGKGDYWKAEDFKKGIPITITENNEANLRLPEEFGDKLYYRWIKKSKHRHYEYEIVVVCPCDELTIDGEKCN